MLPLDCLFNVIEISSNGKVPASILLDTHSEVNEASLYNLPEWINANDADRSTYSFIRKSKDGKNNVLVVLNMTPIYREEYAVGVPTSKKAKLILNSDDERFGGNGHVIPEILTPVNSQCDNRDYMLTFNLAPYTALVFEV